MNRKGNVPDKHYLLTEHRPAIGYQGLNFYLSEPSFFITTEAFAYIANLVRQTNASAVPDLVV